MKSIKLFLLILSLIFLSFFLLISFDLASYDSSYINRKSLTFSSTNLNSKKVKKFFNFYENYENKIKLKISEKHRDFWEIEDPSQRDSLEKIIYVPIKKNNFKPGKDPTKIEKNYANWERSHGGVSSMRFSSLNKINKNNVQNLEVAWKFFSKDGKKGIQANPVVYNGLVYLPTPGNHIVCLNGSTGELVWKYKVSKGFHAAKRGLQIWEDKNRNEVRLYFTNDDQLIALDANNGNPIKGFGKNGIIKIGSSPVPPIIIDEQLVVATFRPSLEIYDLQTGKLSWKYYLRNFEENVYRQNDFTGGNPWGGLSADQEAGLVFLATGNPHPNYTGMSRPGKNLYSSSLLAIDVRNKKKIWHFQETCHDLWNNDLPAPPILTTLDKKDKRIDVVVAVTKRGNTLVLDRYTGESIFDYEMRLTPASKLPGEKTCKYQKFFDLPEPFAKSVFNKEDVTNLSQKSRDYIMSIVEKSNYGSFEPYEDGKYTIQYGENGGATWSGASVDPENNIMFVTSSDIPWLVGVEKIQNSLSYKDKKAKPLRDEEGYPGVKPPWGSLTAINLNSGKKIWQVPLGSYKKLESKGIISGTENFGGATATAGGLVFAAGTLDKKIRAFDASNGNELWSYELPYIGSAPASSYEVDGEQYIVIPASGGIILKMFYGELVEQGDAVIAFKLKK